MKNCNKNSAPRNGTNRLNRLPKALDASFIAIDERNKNALYQFAERLSVYINYYYFDGLEKSSNWQTVFNQNEIRNDGLTEPHLALFDSFLDLVAIAQRDLNQFTAKHLDYFYETVLGFDKKPASPDKVYLTVELAKHISQHVLDDTTAFKAGKNSDKKEQFYKLLSDFSFSHAQVGSIKSILVNQTEKSLIYVSPVANSEDGNGKELSSQDKSWDTFGNSDRDKAKIGFAISSPLFRLSEGRRKITLVIEYTTGKDVKPIISSANFIALASAEKGWEQITLDSADFTDHKTLKLVLSANETNQKIIDYDSKLHLLDFRANYPIIKIELVSSNGLYDDLMFAPIANIKINTDVKEVRNLLVQNSLGKLDPSKPMEIFGAIPTIGANFYIGSSEVFQHQLSTLNLNFEFLNLPGMAFNAYYKSYAEPAKLYELLPLILTLKLDSPLAVAAKKMTNSIADAAEEPKAVIETLSISNKISDKAINYEVADHVLAGTRKYWENEEVKKLFINYVNNSSFKAEISFLDHRSWIPLLPTVAQKLNLFGLSDTGAPTAIFSNKLSVPSTFTANYNTNAGEGFDLNTERGYLKLKFTDGKFGHADYQLAYSRAVLNNVKEDLSTVELPNAPYTPLIQNLSLDYTCDATIDFSEINNANLYLSRVHQFFAITPLGQAEVHSFTNKGSVYLLPAFQNEGELYIGLINAVVPQHVSLLFLVSEGSSNPDFDKATIKWSYLQDNIWNDFKSIDILREQTNGLLTTGIVTLAIPKTVNNDNTLLPAGHVWLRASTAKDVFSVCDMISISAQAAEAQFSIYDDVVPEKLAIEPGVITKLKEPDAAVKKVNQPYGSFNGKPAENGNEYYLRVSERLRHKSRSISLWDYERLILAQFPKVYTAKCISHTVYNGNVASYNSLLPGSVSIITVPDISISNAPNPLKPKVSKNTLEEIKTYINKTNSAFAHLNVQNPIYEEIKLHFHVKLRTGYEENIYLPMLKKRIKSLLAPWISDHSVQLEFGGKIEKSTLIYHLEKLSYVDYITCFKMYLIRPAGLEDISAKDLERAETATAASILTSYSDHNILNINDLPGVNHPDCACVDCDDNVVKSTKQFIPINECGCN